MQGCRCEEVSRMPELSGRKLHLVEEALVTAVASIEFMPDGSFRSDCEVTDMKALLDEMIETHGELAHHARSSRIAVTGKSI